MRTEILFRYKSSRLAEDGAARSRIQFSMSGHRQCLNRAVRQNPAKFDVTSAL